MQGCTSAYGHGGSCTPRPDTIIRTRTPEAVTSALKTWNQQRAENQGFETKDSGKREEYESGMVRDTEDGKPRFGLLLPEGVPYSEQMLTRFAALMARGAEKYTSRNWEKAQGAEELERYKSSALRHLVQWATDETDEDHAAAVMFNLLAGETVKYKLRTKSA
jgi:hypothetical protein